MKKKMQKYTAAVLSAIMTLSAAGAAVPAAAADATNIVVIGDSISAGAKLAEGQLSYAELIEDAAVSVNVQNFAAEGSTTQDVINTLDNAQVKAALADADVILVTVGIHDIMDPFMETAWGFMNKFEFKKFEDVFFANLADYNLTEAHLQVYYNDLIKAAKSNRESASANTRTIGEKLSAYGDAQIVFQNVYNPIDTIENLDELSSKRKLAYDSVCNMLTTVLNESVNTAITEISETYSYKVVDVHSAFLDNAYRYVNLDALDVNPKAAGHQWMAEQILSELALPLKGDVNTDSKADATDAASLLVHAADLGAGGKGTLSGGALAAADTNGDGKVNSQDAAAVLVYATEKGAGGIPTWN